jgi:predicted GIY-YIG superfamily endonuclease
MQETDLTETLDKRGQLDAARGPGCYALEVETPDAADTVARQWHRTHDAAPDGLYSRVANAGAVLYVGASSNVYNRLCDHCGDKRKAAFLEVFPPTDLHSLWPKASADVAFMEEQAIARSISTANRRVWCDGELL